MADKDEEARLKDTILSKTQTICPDNKESAELVSWFRRWGSLELLFHEGTLLQPQFYMVILRFSWLRNVLVQPDPANVRKELSCVLYGVDYVEAPRARPLSMVHPNDQQSSFRNCNMDFFWKITVLSHKFTESRQFSVQNRSKIMSLHINMSFRIWCSLMETNLDISSFTRR